MLKSAAWGLGASCMEKALKSPRGVSFFQTAKNQVAEAKPGVMGGCSFNLHSAFEANLGSSLRFVSN